MNLEEHLNLHEQNQNNNLIKRCIVSDQSDKMKTIAGLYHLIQSQYGDGVQRYNDHLLLYYYNMHTIYYILGSYLSCRSILVMWLECQFLDTEVDGLNPSISMLCP